MPTTSVAHYNLSQDGLGDTKVAETTFTGSGTSDWIPFVTGKVVASVGGASFTGLSAIVECTHVHPATAGGPQVFPAAESGFTGNAGAVVTQTFEIDGIIWMRWNFTAVTGTATASLVGKGQDSYAQN